MIDTCINLQSPYDLLKQQEEACAACRFRIDDGTQPAHAHAACVVTVRSIHHRAYLLSSYIQNFIVRHLSCTAFLCMDYFPIQGADAFIAIIKDRRMVVIIHSHRSHNITQVIVDSGALRSAGGQEKSAGKNHPKPLHASDHTINRSNNKEEP